MRDLLTPTFSSFIRNPYRYFRWSRRISPVLWVNLFDVKGWLVTGFEEAEALLKDPRFIKDRRTVTPPELLPQIPSHVRPAYEALHQMLTFQDAPDHTRIRQLVMKAFTPALVARLRAGIEAACDELVARRIGQTRHELVGDFSYPLPLHGVAALLGAPPEDAGRFRRWSEQFVRVVDLHSSVKDWEEAGAGIIECKQYMDALIVAKRSTPGDDLISGLVAADEGGDMLTADEMASACMLLLIAGHETTANLIANGYYRLLEHPAQYEALRDNPSLTATAIEEMLRYDPPLFVTSRWAGADLTFAGRSMKRGQIAIIALGAANRDPRAVRQPDTFDITRKPNRHLSLASGVHYCLGAALGRMEADVALRTLLTRFHRPVLLEKPRWRPSIISRGLEHLKLEATVQ